MVPALSANSSATGAIDSDPTTVPLPGRAPRVAVGGVHHGGGMSQSSSSTSTGLSSGCRSWLCAPRGACSTGRRTRPCSESVLVVLVLSLSSAPGASSPRGSGVGDCVGDNGGDGESTNEEEETGLCLLTRGDGAMSTAS